MLSVGARLLALFGLYLALVGQASTDEIVAAALCAVSVGCFSLLVPAIAQRQFSFRHIPWLRLAASTSRSLVTETARVGAALARSTPRPGAFERRPLAAERGPAGNARRALVTLATSLTPNTYVVAVLTGRQELLVHSLVPPRHPQEHT